VKYNELSLGQIEAVANKLGGMEGVEAFLRDELTVVRKEPVVSAVPSPSLFSTPEEQIETLLRIARDVWKDTSITESAIRALGNPPECPASDANGLYTVVLLSETGDAIETFRRNWDACVHIHKPEGTWKWDGLLFTPKGVRVRKGAKPAPIGLRWAIAELGRAFKGHKVRDVRRELDASGRMGMGQELLLIGALHSNWAKATNGDDTPFVDAPDLEVAPCARGGFIGAPCLSFNRGNRRVDLGAKRVGDSLSLYGSGSLQ
jgi:hypothetical protein